MQEIELKFLVPESRLKGLMRQAKVKSSQVTQLAAHYYDTPDQQLAQAGIGLRIRKENDTWVQTIKAAGDGIAARLEHNAVLDNEQVQTMLDDNELMPDLTIYEDTSVAPTLADFKLKKLQKALTRLYVTDVQRTTRLLTETNDDDINSCIEVAYDQGEIIHGTDKTQQKTIQEIEFELVSGDIDFLFMTAKTWCKRYKLCLSTITKAENGGLLINEQDHSPAVDADLSQLQVDKDSSAPAFIRSVVHNCLLQILPNSSAIIAGSTDHEHILQLRVGIDRLHAALKAFADFSDEINPEWLSILEQTANLLGTYYQLAYIGSHIEPELQALGAPAVDWTTDIEDIKITPINTLQANDFQITLLELIAFTMSDPSIEPHTDQLACDKLAKILTKQYKKCIKTSKKIEAFSRLDDNDDIDEDVIDDSQSEDKLCNHLKELRYFSEFSIPLLSKKKSKKKTRRWLKRLAKAQSALAQRNNDSKYHAFYALKSATDTNALYGAGWFAAMLTDDPTYIEARLAKFRDSATFW
ncbi:CYTH and CHAD domain-containing protein [Psychrobacter sp. PP-21]|uniref:CYTH and CHAD domain-containing protein n=1 Tax=Psychrobacter sp. PP-21 TaxID=2957503 RepID=UPI0029B912FF|nr:CYTH and CHAD domain-containing protein [Psychrobacter sp. PP-21]MDX2373897.1 CYTH and CHAD domain-containing protein [Psychrobacter sp. PP-21]